MYGKAMKYTVKEIPENSFFTKTTFLDKAFVLTSPEMPFSNELKKALANWSFDSVLSEGQPSKDYVMDQAKSAKQEDGKLGDLSNQADAAKIKKAEAFVRSFYSYTEDLFAGISTSETMDFKQVAEQIKSMIDYLREDWRFIMRVQNTVKMDMGTNYLISHSVYSTIISILIGTFLKMPSHRLIELGVAALLHEVGMFKLPPQTYLSTKPLTLEERKAILKHPIFGYNVLKTYDFPMAVCLAALEHHERENGGGYPQHIAGERISLYSKIIAVACSYEAINSKRPHKDAKDGYSVMLELLRNDEKQYDKTIIRALALSLSIYPIGLYVMLSTGKMGQVVDVNPENPRYPIVQIFGEFTPDGKNKTAQTSQDGVYIVRPLTEEEINK
jgi:HD-GYP domain-containing protein (c-di-GMP phosphodiesterase class II)